MKRKSTPGPKSNGSKLAAVVVVKMSAKDHATLRANAKRFTKGNLSAWIRYAGRRYIPKKGESVPDAA